MSRRITKADREKFEEYLIEMDDVLERFIEDAARAGYKLDYSFESLEQLEQYFIQTAPQSDDPELIVQRAARYYGEVFRVNFGGKWRLSDKDPKNMYYGFPVIYGFYPNDIDYEFCPLFHFRIFSRNPRKGLLRRTIDIMFPPALRPKSPPGS